MDDWSAGRLFLAAGLAVLLATSTIGCGGGEASTSAGPVSPTTTTSKSKGPYIAVLQEFHQAVLAKASYDAYGFAEYLPSAQRAAIDAFCVLADRASKDPEVRAFGDSRLLNREITRKAEADLKSEQGIVAPASVRKAIARLRAVLRLESLDHELAGSYVAACYR